MGRAVVTGVAASTGVLTGAVGVKEAVVLAETAEGAEGAAVATEAAEEEVGSPKRASAATPEADNGVLAILEDEEEGEGEEALVLLFLDK